MIEERYSLAAGEPVLLHGRIIIPIVHIQRFCGGRSYAASINPVAVLIVDGKDVFFATINEGTDKIAVEAFLAETFGIISTGKQD